MTKEKIKFVLCIPLWLCKLSFWFLAVITAYIYNIKLFIILLSVFVFHNIISYFVLKYYEKNNWLNKKE